MRSFWPVFVAVASLVSGWAVGRMRLRLRALPRPPLDPAVRRRLHRLTSAVLMGLLALGLVLLTIGWWAWGSAPAGLTPQASASVAYTAAALELFFGGMLAPQVVRRERPPFTP